MQDHFWSYLDVWRTRFPRRRPLRWRDDWLQNGYCRDCRYCCGQQDSNKPFYMALLPEQIHPDLRNDFYLHSPNTAYMDARGCKAATAQGCRLPRAQRPVACSIFPLVLTGGELYLYQTCPAVLFTPFPQLAGLGLEAAAWLRNFSRANVRRISSRLPAQTLAEGYIALHIRVAGR